MDDETLLKLTDASGDAIYIRAGRIVAVYPYWFDNDPEENRYWTVEVLDDLEAYENGIVRLEYESGLALERYLDRESVDLTRLSGSEVSESLRRQVKTA